MKIIRLAELSVLTAASLIVFIIELRIPDILPIPGFKIGLANIFTLYAVYRFKPSETAMMVFVRILLGSVFSGNLSAVIFSFSGALLCLVGMLPLSRIIPADYIWLCSIFGGLLHNVGQIFAAVFVMGSFSVLYYLPVLAAAGCIAGLFTGLCAFLIMDRTKKISSKKK